MLNMCVFVTLVIQHSRRMRRIILSSLASSVLQNFSTLSHKGYDLRKNVIEHKMSFDFIYNFCMTYFSF
jgi:hypothetical protein